MYIIGIPEERENRAQELFEEILAKSVTKSMTTPKSQIQQLREYQTEVNIKNTQTLADMNIYTHLVSHIQSAENKYEILKAVRKKKRETHISVERQLSMDPMCF